eukprot:355040-Chlamydomonas_euryale.AAC.9
MVPHKEVAWCCRCLRTFPRASRMCLRPATGPATGPCSRCCPCTTINCSGQRLCRPDHPS